MDDALTVLTALWTRAWAETPELLTLSVVFWVAVLVGAVLRWGLHRTRASSVVFAALPVVGVVGVVLAGLDLATGGEPQFVHTSMAAYLAAPLGVGARVIARVDAIVTERRWTRDTPRPGRSPTSPVASPPTSARAASTSRCPTSTATPTGSSPSPSSSSARPACSRSTGCTSWPSR